MSKSLLRALAMMAFGATSVMAQATAPMPAAADLQIEYDQHVKPILAAKCFECHGPRQQQSGLRLDLRQNALRGGDYGVVIVPGRSADSKLIQRLVGSAAGVQMPPTGALDSSDIAILRAWIDQGAQMPGRASEAEAVITAIDPKVERFIAAIHRYDLDGVRRALKGDPALARSADGTRSTALMHAAYSGTLDIMNALIEAGADVNAKNNRNATALHWAVRDAAKMKLLLAKGADPNAKTVEGRTILHSAAMQPAGAPLVKLLLESGANPNAKLIVGLTPLTFAIQTSLESTRLLLAAGADPNIRAETGVTAVMSPALPGAMPLLVAAGGDVHAKGKKGETAIAMAAGNGNLDDVKLLLTKGVDVNVPDFRGYTPLMLAAHSDQVNTEIVQLLLAHGANIKAVAEDETALSLAEKRGDTDVTKLLKKAATCATEALCERR